MRTSGSAENQWGFVVVGSDCKTAACKLRITVCAKPMCSADFKQYRIHTVSRGARLDLVGRLRVYGGVPPRSTNTSALKSRSRCHSHLGGISPAAFERARA